MCNMVKFLKIYGYREPPVNCQNILALRPFLNSQTVLTNKKAYSDIMFLSEKALYS